MLLTLFLSFLKIGLFTFGGGYAMIPLVQEVAIKTFGIDEDLILNFIAISESTPGPIAINMATFVGFEKCGVLGAFFATLGVVLPSFIIILLIASIAKNIMKKAGVKAFFVGVRPVVIGLITATGITVFLQVVLSLKNVYSQVIFDYKSLIIFIIIALIYFLYKIKRKKRISSIFLIVLSAILGIIVYTII